MIPANLFADIIFCVLYPSARRKRQGVRKKAFKTGNHPVHRIK